MCVFTSQLCRICASFRFDLYSEALKRGGCHQSSRVHVNQVLHTWVMWRWSGPCQRWLPAEKMWKCWKGKKVKCADFSNILWKLPKRIRNTATINAFILIRRIKIKVATDKEAEAAGTNHTAFYQGLENWFERGKNKTFSLFEKENVQATDAAGSKRETKTCLITAKLSSSSWGSKNISRLEGINNLSPGPPQIFSLFLENRHNQSLSRLSWLVSMRRSSSSSLRSPWRTEGLYVIFKSLWRRLISAACIQTWFFHSWATPHDRRPTDQSDCSHVHVLSNCFLNSAHHIIAHLLPHRTHLRLLCTHFGSCPHLLTKCTHTKGKKASVFLCTIQGFGLNTFIWKARFF